MATAHNKSDRTNYRQYLIVGALDFGTSYSGYAYSYNHDLNKVFTGQCNAPHRGGISEKTPTCILFDKDKKFKSFGYRAEEEYGTHCDELEGKVSDWYFF